LQDYFMLPLRIIASVLVGLAAVFFAAAVRQKFTPAHHDMVKLAAALLCSLLCTAVYRHFYLQCAQPPPTRSVRAMVQARYDALLMPYFPCFLIVACVACTVALLSSERANRERGLDSWLLGYFATTMPLFFGATHLLTRDLPVAGRCAVYPHDVSLDVAHLPHQPRRRLSHGG
jgi:hypothetical protein